MSSLSPLGPAIGSTSSAAQEPVRPQALPVQQASAAGVPVSANAIQATGSAAATAEAKRPADKETLTEAAKKVSELVSNVASDLKFSVDDDLDIPVVKVIDRSTDKVIRQIPSEEMLALAKALDKLVGVLYKNKA